MKQTLSLLSATLLTLGLAGCSATQTATNTNETVNTNVDTVVANVDLITNTEQGDVNTNTNTVVDDVDTNSTANADNTNTNTDSGETIDTSDWLTYTNETLSLSFNYPKDWELERTQDGDDFTEIIDNNDIYDHQLVNLYIHWSDRHEDIVYESGVTNPTLDRWLNCDYVYDLQSKCNIVLMNGIEVVKREGQIEPPFGDDYVALAYKQNDFTVVINARSLLRESFNDEGNKNLDGLNYISAVIETMDLN